jgi:glycosyltransferase involved in cell wall biosynthesis
MSEKVLVSVVTPVYNGAEYIERCLESVMAQEYERVEHIVQDGGSSDGTVEILERYRDKVEWVSEPDRGQSDGLNRALQRARGDIIVVLNADDELMPHAVSWAVEQLEKYPEAAVVYGDVYIVGPGGEIIQESRGPEPYDFEKVLCVEQVLPAQAAFIRRRSLETVGYYADVTLETCPDYEMWVRLGLKYPMQYVSEFVTRYRWHAASEGRQVSFIPKTVQAKRQVMNRVFNDEQTPAAILQLRPRAYSGVIWWGACMLLWNHQVARGILALLYSLYIYPSIEQIPRLKYFFDRVGFYANYPLLWKGVAGFISKSIWAIEKGLAVLNIKKRKDNYGP